MLRTTAIKIIEGKANARTCASAADILRTKFSPRLSWYEKATLIVKVDDWKEVHSRRAWNTERLAQFLELDETYVKKLRMLWFEAQRFPRLKYIPNWKVAYDIVHLDKNVLYEIDKAIVTRGIIPDDQQIDNNE